MGDLFEVQDELAAAIVGAVVPEIGAHERRLASRARPEALGAWELLHRGYAAYYRYDDAGFAEAEALFRRGLALDPDFAPLHRALALLKMQAGGTLRTEHRERTLGEGFAAARRALELDPRDDEALGILGQLHAISGDPESGIDLIERALRLNPNNAMLHIRRGTAELLREPNDLPLIRAMAERALTLSPHGTFTWSAHMIAAWGWQEEDIEDPRGEVLRHLLEACRQEHCDGIAFVCAAASLQQHGRSEEARVHVASALRRQSNLSLAGAKAFIAGPHQTLASAEEVWGRYRPLFEALVPLGLPRE